MGSISIVNLIETQPYTLNCIHTHTHTHTHTYTHTRKHTHTHTHAHIHTHTHTIAHTLSLSLSFALSLSLSLSLSCTLHTHTHAHTHTHTQWTLKAGLGGFDINKKGTAAGELKVHSVLQCVAMFQLQCAAVCCDVPHMGHAQCLSFRASLLAHQKQGGRESLMNSKKKEYHIFAMHFSCHFEHLMRQSIWIHGHELFYLMII